MIDFIFKNSSFEKYFQIENFLIKLIEKINIYQSINGYEKFYNGKS